MKSSLKTYIILTSLLVGFVSSVFAQPHTGGDPAQDSGNPPSIGAPVGDGLYYLLILAFVYLGVKVYAAYKHRKQVTA